MLSKVVCRVAVDQADDRSLIALSRHLRLVVAISLVEVVVAEWLEQAQELAVYRPEVGQRLGKGYILPLLLDGRVDGVLVTVTEELLVDAKPLVERLAL